MAAEERLLVEPPATRREMGSGRQDRPRSEGGVPLDGISWGAVFAGVVVAIVTQLVLGLFGLSFGAGSFDPGTPDNPTMRTFSLVAAIWWAVSSIVAVASGAYVAGRLAGRRRVSTGGWHGLVTWALTTVVVFWLVGTTVGNVVGGTLRTVTDAAGSAASVVGQAAQTGIASSDDPMGAIDRAVQDAIPASDPGGTRDAAIAAIRSALSGGSEEAREQAAAALSQASGVPIGQARDQVRQYEAQYRAQRDQFQARATEVAEASARAVSRGALLTAIGLVLGAVVAWFSGRFGTENLLAHSLLRRNTAA